MCRATLGNQHASTLVSLNNLGNLLERQGKVAAAERLLREVVEASRATLGSWHRTTVQSISNLGALLAKHKGNLELLEKHKGDLEGQAEQLMREAPKQIQTWVATLQTPPLDQRSRRRVDLDRPDTPQAH